MALIDFLEHYENSKNIKPICLLGRQPLHFVNCHLIYYICDMKIWAKNYDYCLKCSKTDNRHKGKGLCISCYEKSRDSTTINKRESQRRYREKNREKVRESQRLEKQKKKKEIHTALGSVCVKCGFSDSRALQIDHINGGGYTERKLYPTNPKKYYSDILKSIKNNEKKYQLLCANCNWIKRFENNEIRKSSDEKN